MVCIANAFTLTKKNKETKRRENVKKTKRQYNADKNSNSLNSFQTLVNQHQITVNQSLSAVLCGSVSIIITALTDITT